MNVAVTTGCVTCGGGDCVWGAGVVRSGLGKLAGRDAVESTACSVERAQAARRQASRSRGIRRDMVGLKKDYNPVFLVEKRRTGRMDAYVQGELFRLLCSLR